MPRSSPPPSPARSRSPRRTDRHGHPQRERARDLHLRVPGAARLALLAQRCRLRPQERDLPRGRPRLAGRESAGGLRAHREGRCPGLCAAGTAGPDHHPPDRRAEQAAGHRRRRHPQRAPQGLQGRHLRHPAHGRAAAGHEPEPGRCRLLRAHAAARDASGALQPGHQPVRGPGALRQRPARGHDRAEDRLHPVHRPREEAVPRAQPQGHAAVRVRHPRRGPLRRLQPRGLDDHQAGREGHLLPAVQPGRRRPRRQPAQPERRFLHGLPVGANSPAGHLARDPPEVRLPQEGDRGGRARPLAPEVHADLPALPPVGGRHHDARRRPRGGRRQVLPDRALRRLRQDQHHRLDRPPPALHLRGGRAAGVRLGHRGHRPHRAGRPAAGGRPADRADLRHRGGRGPQEPRGRGHQQGRPGEADAAAGQPDHRGDAADLPRRARTPQR